MCLLSTVAGVAKSKSSSIPASSLAACTASLTAKCAAEEQTRGGSPVALLLRKEPFAVLGKFCINLVLNFEEISIEENGL
mmetsp:Transcript_35174/g.47248  ORF Transcript_35174/g.47248 Transcript_35174/m.47248 type:complete len:80 (-) Transcript_35174:624-863(-)